LEELPPFALSGSSWQWQRRRNRREVQRSVPLQIRYSAWILLSALLAIASHAGFGGCRGAAPKVPAAACATYALKASTRPKLGSGRVRPLRPMIVFARHSNTWMITSLISLAMQQRRAAVKEVVFEFVAKIVAAPQDQPAWGH